MKTFVARLWDTPLGRDFYSFMTDPMPDERFFPRLDQMTDRLLQDAPTALTRISIVQILSEDMYTKGQLSDDGEKRLRLLEGRVSLERIHLSQTPIKTMVTHAGVILVASLPFGSPTVRRTVGEAGRTLLIRLERFLGRTPPSTLEAASWRLIFSREVGRDYELKKALSVYLNALGAYSFLYLFYYEYKNVPGGDVVPNPIRAYDYEQLLEQAAHY